MSTDITLIKGIERPGYHTDKLSSLTATLCLDAQTKVWDRITNNRQSIDLALIEQWPRSREWLYSKLTHDSQISLYFILLPLDND